MRRWKLSTSFERVSVKKKGENEKKGSAKSDTMRKPRSVTGSDYIGPANKFVRRCHIIRTFLLVVGS